MTLVVLAHGTLHPAGVRIVEAVAARVRYRLPGIPVRLAYVAVNRPSLSQVLAEAGDDAVVVPLLCAPDPDLLQGPLVADPLLGPERLLAGVVTQRLRAAGARPGQPVVLVTAGSDHASSQGDAVRTAQLLEEVWGGPVRPAHLTGRGQRMSEVVADFGSAGEPSPVAAPYLVAPGHFYDKARADARSLGIPVLADVLGDHPHVAEAVARRYRAATARRFALSLC